MKKFRIPLLVIALMVAMLLPVSAGEKVTLCHKPGTPAELTLEVAAAAADAHLAHGDYLGECVNLSEGCQALNLLDLDAQTNPSQWMARIVGSFNPGETIYTSVTALAGTGGAVIDTILGLVGQSQSVVEIQHLGGSATGTLNVEYTIPDSGDYYIWLGAYGQSGPGSDGLVTLVAADVSCTAP